MTGTRECDRCWELSRRIQQDPELTVQMMTTLDVKIPWWKRPRLLWMLSRQLREMQAALSLAAARLDFAGNWLTNGYLPNRHRHTEQCLHYAATTGRAFCIAACKDSREAHAKSESEDILSVRGYADAARRALSPGGQRKR
jgi:hypothetical protein